MKAYKTNSLREIRRLAGSGSHGHGAHDGHAHGPHAPPDLDVRWKKGEYHDWHGHDPEPKPPHLEGENPALDFYNRPWSTQAADVMKESEGMKMLPMYLPVSSTDRFADGKPASPQILLSRRDLMDGVLDENYKNGNPASIYKAYFMAWLCLGLAILAMGFNIYVAAVFAYLAGYYWSEKELNIAWSVQWWKTKALTFTA
ncbi:MAG: hypothetical protein V1787_02365 [Candidatus Micrarchaeota archaeon]